VAKPSGDHIPLGVLFSVKGLRVMFAQGRWDSAFERRSIGRTKIAKGALLFFSTQSGVRTCFVKDVTNVGAGIRAQDLPALPLGFELSFDNFRTSRKCRLIWRDGDFIGLAFEN
jgi:hypothetical protein